MNNTDFHNICNYEGRNAMCCTLPIVSYHRDLSKYWSIILTRLFSSSKLSCARPFPLLKEVFVFWARYREGLEKTAAFEVLRLSLHFSSCNNIGVMTAGDL